MLAASTGAYRYEGLKGRGLHVGRALLTLVPAHTQPLEQHSDAWPNMQRVLGQDVILNMLNPVLWIRID